MATIPLGARSRRLETWLVGVAAIWGTLIAVHYHRLNLTLSHYDARGHLVVARRILDNITPGWQQIGAVWLPLPHVLNAIPVQIDRFYQSGSFAVGISVVCFAVTTGLVARIVRALTESRAAAVTGAAVFALNPNVLYLQATPMTEPLLFALMTAAVALLLGWCGKGQRTPSPAVIGLALALACLTRYEAWPVTACGLAIAVWARRRAGEAWGQALARVSKIAVYPAGAVLGFMAFSRVVIGQWFVTSGFFVPDNPARGDPLGALAEVVGGIRTLSGDVVVITGAVGLLLVAVAGLVRRARAHHLIALSLLAAASLPWLAFVEGHPYRVRYMVPLVIAEAIGVGVAARILRRPRYVPLIALGAVLILTSRPIDSGAPMILEAQLDRPNSVGRRVVTDCLRAHYGGETVMASMGSLGHYMQELFSAGLRIRDFLHEGNGDIWLGALREPRAFVGWILIEEEAEGGDLLAQISRAHPEFLDGFARICEGAGVALYRRE